MMRFVQRGSTDQSAWVQLLNADGDYVTGLTYSDVTITVRRFVGGRLVSELSLTAAELSAIDDPHTDGGFVEDSSRKRYRVDLQDAAVATGLDSADKVELKVEATGVVGNTSEEIMLVNELPWDLGGGANTVTITVDDDSDNLLENAEVTIWSNGTIIDRQSTNASGVATLNADDGTYTLIVAVPTGGYSSSRNSSFAVSGTTAASVELTAHVTAPSSAGRVTGYGYTDIDGVVTASTPATLTGVGRPTSGSTSTGLLSNYNATNSSDSNGKVSFTNLIPGASYLLAYAGKTKKWDIPADATGEVAMDTIVGDGV